MLTHEQAVWISQLNDADRVGIIPLDTRCDRLFLDIKKRIQNALGSAQPVVHRGASALGISGQDEIDIYVPVAPDIFDERVRQLIKICGEPLSHYPMKRARFATTLEGKHIDIFVINQDDVSWQEGEQLYQILMSHPEVLEEYRILKESSAGQSTREYYRRKIEFINKVLAAGHAIQVRI